MADDDRVTLPSFPTLTSLPATEHPELVAPAVAAALAGWPGAAEVAVVEIDPDVADTAAMSEAYDIPMTAGGNCVVVAGVRAGDERVAACVVRADTRADVNTLVRTMLDVRKASFLSMDRAVAETGMEHGGTRANATALNAAAGAAESPPSTGAVANVGWDRWTPVNAVAIGAHVVGSIGQLIGNRGRVAQQEGVAGMSALKTLL